VLAHERAHVRARHDLVLIPFTSLRRAFPRSRVIARAQWTVALLIEMMADDHALRTLLERRMPAGEPLPARELAMALLRFGAAGPNCAPEGALTVGGGGGGEITARVNRLLEPPPPLPRAAQAGIILASALLIASVVLLLVIP
jgi:hypothetical protein